MNKIEIAKKLTNFVVGIGTGAIIGGIARNNTNYNNIITKVTVTAAVIVISKMTSDAIDAYTDRKIDEIADWYRENVTN